MRAPLADSGVGSSPRVWGTLDVAPQQAVVRRFIPTGVGNAGCVGSVGRFCAVHPHGCGERPIKSDER